jgi:hypothetical protein
MRRWVVSSSARRRYQRRRRPSLSTSTHESALSGGVLHFGYDRRGWHRHAAHGRQHPPVHRHLGRGAQADLRHRRPARLLRRRGSRQRYLPLRPQCRRDAGGALDAGAGSARRAPAPEAPRGGPPAHAGRPEDRRAPSGQERDQLGPHERSFARDRCQRVVRRRVRRRPHHGLRRA